MANNVSPLFKAMVIGGMLLFGTCTVVTQKIILSMEGTGRGGQKNIFKKPWFQTEAMFIGMFGCLAVYEITRVIKAMKARRGGEYQALNEKTSSVQAAPVHKMPVWKQYVYVCAPAMCDMCATAMMNIGLLWIDPSVWQMLRGSMVVFSAIFSKVFLKRNLHASHWVGVCMVVFALLVVAFASLMATSEETSSEANEGKTSDELNLKPSTTQQIIGYIMVVAAQIIQASQIVVEEFLLREIDLPPTLIVGLEGFWGGIVCSVLLIPVCWITKPYGEDTIDTFIMLGKNPKILLAVLFYSTVILFYNMLGMYVTLCTSAVIRTILEGLRTACIWAVNLVIHYAITKEFGERWSKWSYLQFSGFLFLLSGMFVYNSIVRINGFYYDDQQPKKAEEPKQTEA